MADEGNWCLIESDPGVFTELISNMGCRGVQVEEIWSLDEGTMGELKPVYGLIFLFKWQNNRNHQNDLPPPDITADHVFFANQVITNACATQAILSILLNRDDIDIGQELKNFKEFTQDFPPDMKGLAISNSDLIRSVHNSFARSDPFVNEIVDPDAGKDQDVYHFIAYLPKHGALYELDGLSSGPVNLGACDENDWVRKANEAIMKRMEQYGASELHFSLMALTKDRIELYEEQIEELDGLILSLSEDAVEERNRLNSERSVLTHKLQIEKEKRQRWHRENALRKHNFIPLIYNLLRHLAEKDQLQSLVTKAKEKAATSAASKKQ
ncbi:ubiquitinyl hydrolase [Rhizopus microsporus var. microsporus]|uniref:Ubiquitin carboxyl-terminal hydrolase n=2 Tax=Rhizopus microsporus TaxID=58291 RepID=A0A2G4SUL4_RHIZD|nr:ubiquitinyl hydrolase [Rhizopus microsporus ATCC 52813]ORE07573.1 ubiquitinyl hydrolase [Rhizopus microsporus var. microsporus]PHZ12459.1 ubiquitinyl hydrolase [Rhizopus microsporus ATCC 52813]